MQWFEDNSQYTEQTALPSEFMYPDLSLVRVYPNGKTQPGWGAKTFMEGYRAGDFEPRRALVNFEKRKRPFAVVMRSIPVLCVDIDGKNGGIETAQVLALPRTKAEISKSMNGYHLFYPLLNSVWDPKRGYGEYPDIIGLVPGIDIKATGLVYHYPQQMWNTLPLAPLPRTLATLIGNARDARMATRLARAIADDLDPDELVLVHDQLKEQLHGRFTAGNRNTKLYAIGAQMFKAQYPSWDLELYDRGMEIGLEEGEVSYMIKNIERYA